MTVEQDSAVMFGAMAMSKAQAGEPTTPEEDRFVIRTIGLRAQRHAAAAAERASQSQLVPA